jgi:hypothetical protein
VKSVGKIKEIPSATSAAQDPKTGGWTYWNDAAFKVRAQRTLFMRVPFGQQNHIMTQVGAVNPTYYDVLSDGWYERYR